MEKSELITKKIRELIALSEVEGERNVQIVMLILAGARLGDQDGMLATKMQEYAKDVLKPTLEMQRNSHRASLN